MEELPFLYLKVAALIVVGIASFCDLRTHKIPNKLTFPASAIGIAMQIWYFASRASAQDFYLRLLAGFLFGVLGWLIGVFIMSFTKIFLRQMGHGDTKLVACVGTFLGPWLVLVVYLYYCLCYGVYSTFRLALTVPWNQVFLAVEMKKAGVDTAVDLDEFSKIKKQIIPVAPLIALGTICCIAFEKPTLAFLGFK